jgi:hypothetical protein
VEPTELIMDKREAAEAEGAAIRTQWAARVYLGKETQEEPARAMPVAEAEEALGRWELMASSLGEFPFPAVLGATAFLVL